jgi:hypothetical protein
VEEAWSGAGKPWLPLSLTAVDGGVLDGEEDCDRGLILAGHNLIAVCDSSKTIAAETLGRRLATSKMAKTTIECHLESLSDVINAGIADEIYSRAPPLIKAAFIGARTSYLAQANTLSTTWR